jgi:hypothetical protein
MQMAGNAITGRDGDAKIGSTQICEVTKWSFNPKVNIVSYSSNKTAGYKQKLFGVREATGNLEGVWDASNPSYSVVAEATTDIALKLYITSTQFWAITAVIESFSQDVNIDAGEMVTWSASFHAKGTWTSPVAAMMMPEDAEALKDMGITNPDAPVFHPFGPPRMEGELDGAYADRLAKWANDLRNPPDIEEVVRRVMEKVTVLSTPEGFTEMVDRAAERAAMKMSESLAAVVAEAVMKKLQAA